MIFIGRKNIKLFKLFLVSPILEKFLLLLYLVFLPLMAFYPEDFSTYTNFDLGISLTQSFGSTQFSGIENKSEFYTWAKTYIVPSYYTTKITPNMPLQGLRMRQYRYPCDPNDLSSNCIDMIKNVVEGADPFLPSILDCVYKSCDEFMFRPDNTNSDYVSGSYGKYPMFGFRVELGLDEATAIHNLQKLEKNGWIDDRTVALVIEANYFNYWKNRYVVFRGLLEFHGGKVLTPTFSFGSFCHYYDRNVIIFLYVMFVIQSVLLLFKIMFEMTMICNRIICLGQISHLASNFAFIVLFAIKLSYINKSTPEARAASNLPFVLLHNIVLIENYCKFMIFVNFLFYPFKIFQLISWFKYTNFIVKFWVAIYRTLPGISLFFMLLAVLVLNWSLGFMIIFQDFIIQFKDFGSAILSIFTINFRSLDFNDLQLLIGTYNDIFFFIYFLQSFVIILIIVYFFAILTDLFYRSALIELNQESPNEKLTHEKLEEMQFKFDRFIKELKKEFDKDKKDLEDNLFSHPQNKILIWLDCSHGFFTVYEDVREELKGFKVQTRKFIHKEEVIQFLDYLFKLKPNLLSFRAGERFRIVAENYANSNSHGDSRSVDNLIDWLKHVGCRVPILIYSDVKLERDVQIYLKKKYPSILFVCDKTNLVKYCRMNDSIYSFYESLNKQENRDKVDEGDSFTDEESFFE